MLRLLLASLFLCMPLPIDAQAQAEAPATRDLVINEIHYRPSDQAEEFVELFNRSEKTFELQDFRIADDLLRPVTITDASIRLAPGEYAVLVRDGEAFSKAFPGIAYIEIASWPVLRDAGDASLLYYGEQVIDSVGYAPSWGGYERGASLERIDPAGPSDRAYNYGSSDGSPTPGQQNSIFAPDLEPPVPGFAAARSEAVEVFFDKPLDASSIQPSRFHLSEGTRPRTAVLLDEDTGVRLVFETPIESDQLHVSGIRDLTGNVLDEGTVAIAYPILPFAEDRPAGLAVNEIMYAPLADAFDNRPDQPEYIELINLSERTVDLTGAFWSNAPNEHGEADTTWLSSDRIALPPGGFAVIHATPDGADLEEAFPALRQQASAVLVPQSSSRLGLRNDGDHIQLHRADGEIVDRLAYDPSWHHPGLQETRGIALERIAPQLPSSSPQNWTSSVHASGGTPGRENSIHLAPAEEQSNSQLAVTPSPFSPDGDGHEDVTSISYHLESEAALVRIRIYDSMGRRVRTLTEARLGGRHEDTVVWDGLDDRGQSLRLGIYVVHLQAVNSEGGTVETLRQPVVLAHPFR